VRRDLPSGTVTFLFTDVEGSSRLLQELGTELYVHSLDDHRKVVRAACDRHLGVEVDTQGDSFFIAFPSAQQAVDAATDAQRSLERGPIRVRMGIHTGTAQRTTEGYVGPDVHKAARIASAGHGGQVLISSETRALLQGEMTDLGEHARKGAERPR
jgi:class 3 adenylate cyclase